MLQEVNAWTEQVTIPTYPVGKPEKNPIFLEKRVYQGSRGSVYPFPIIESISDEKTDQVYTAVFIENAFLKIMILPGLGGRVQRAWDKIRQRDFIYYNRVIKPALVGLTGPWISGGIEFNWPQHHRPSTFEPVDFSIENHPDGSVTVWTNEIELMSRTKGMTGFTLYKDKAYLEVKARIFNRSPFPQTFLWWANPAIKVNEHTQSVFPPDVYAVFDHGKRDVSSFPIATGKYYKVDYAPGTDISWYKNIPVPTSYMAINSGFDFIGCYEHDTQCGMLHVANHHISPGKKQWTWGTGNFGKAWEKNLTDDDGPYIELMCGVYTDNQPDFSWIEVDEEKTFEQYFMPYAGIGIVKNVTRDAAINVEIHSEKVTVKIYATGFFEDAGITLQINGDIVFSTKAPLSPYQIFEQEIPLPENTVVATLVATVQNKDGKRLVAYEHQNFEQKAPPPPATPAADPKDLTNNELLYLNGLHLEQYRHATYRAADYYEEALRRDPQDVRCNIAMGLWTMRRGKLREATHYFRNAIERLELRNPNPKNGDAYYYLGVCLLWQQRQEEAYAAFYKSTWNDACQHKAFFQLARIAVQRGDWEEAELLLQKSLARNSSNPRARHLLAVIYKKSNDMKKALTTVDAALCADPFNYGCYFEKYAVLSSMDERKNDAVEVKKHMEKMMRGAFNSYHEHALDYIHAGLHEEAKMVFRQYLETEPESTHPLAWYFLAWLHQNSGDHNAAQTCYDAAFAAAPDFCFPNKVEDIAVLQTAMILQPNDYKAPYYLGNYWYAHEQYDDAIECWEHSVEISETFPTALRNLSLAYYNKRSDKQKARLLMEKAFSLDEADARILMELDQLYKLTNVCSWERLQLLETHANLVDMRDDLYLERVTLYNGLGDYETAWALLEERRFHPWEGGEGKVVKQYLACLTGMAKMAFSNGAYQEALDWLAAAENYPDNLGEGKLPGTPENELQYLKALTLRQMGKKAAAIRLFEDATGGDSEPRQAIFYNDPQPDNLFYQGLSWLQLGETQKAGRLFERLIAFGKKHLDDEIRIDYFAVSLPELLVFNQDLDRKNKLHCQYVIGLGLLGLQRWHEAVDIFREILADEVSHQGALIHLHIIPFLKSYAYFQPALGQAQPA